VVDVSKYKPLIEAACLLSFADGVGLAVCSDDITRVVADACIEESAATFAATLLDATPSKVTRAFSERHERLEELNRVRIALESSGMEKLDCAVRIKRGMASPSVTLGRSGDKVVVAHAVADGFEHVLPVNPFIHIQAQVSKVDKAKPSFWHAVAGSCAHFCCVLNSGVGFLLSTSR